MGQVGVCLRRIELIVETKCQRILLDFNSHGWLVQQVVNHLCITKVVGEFLVLGPDGI